MGRHRFVKRSHLIPLQCVRLIHRADWALLFAPLLISLRPMSLQHTLIYCSPLLSHAPRLHCELALGECQHHTSLPAPHQILFQPRPRSPHSELRSRLRGCARRSPAWKQTVERRSMMCYADAGRRRLRVGGIVRLRCTTLGFSMFIC